MIVGVTLETHIRSYPAVIINFAKLVMPGHVYVNNLSSSVQVICRAFYGSLMRLFAYMLFTLYCIHSSVI